MSYEAQIDQLAKWILENIEGEPSQDYGAVECAVEIMKRQKEKIESLEKELRELVKKNPARRLEPLNFK